MFKITTIDVRINLKLIMCSVNTLILKSYEIVTWVYFDKLKLLYAARIMSKCNAR